MTIDMTECSDGVHAMQSGTRLAWMAPAPARTGLRVPSHLGAALLGLALALSGAVAKSEPIALCSLPGSIAPVPIAAAPPGEVHTDVRTAAYMLSLTWTPEYCRVHGAQPDAEVQCRDNHFGFTVHGLWPNGPEDVHPRFCRPAAAVDAATLRANLCMTPSAWLLEHEWAAHGSCGWASPQPYFAKARALRTALDVPVLKAGADELTTAGAIRTAFLERNPALRRQDLYVQAGPDGRLQEVRICYDLTFRPAPCLHDAGAQDPAPIRVTPLR
jgi:ribonuclease T2